MRQVRDLERTNYMDMKNTYQSKTRGLQALIALAMLLTWASCAESNLGTDSMTNVDESLSEETMEQADRVKKIFYQIPSPVEMVSLIQEQGSRYTYKVLNDVDNRNDYTTAGSKALNLGIYGADLSYTSVFNQNQESIIYLSTAKELADELGVSGAFSDETMSRVEENLEDRDSLMHIITETFYELDAYLKENGRSNISAQVITGGWIEGLYLACMMVDPENPTGTLAERVVDQKHSLTDLIALNEAYNKAGSLDNIITDLNGLKEIFDRAKPEEIDNTQSMVNGTLVLGANDKLTLAPDDLKAIITLAKDIRGKYVQA